MVKILVCISIVFLFFVPCIGHVHADIDMQVFPGFDGYQKPDRWLPLRVELSSDGGELEGEVVVETWHGSTGAKCIYSVPINLFGAVRKIKYLYVWVESFQRSLKVGLVDKSGRELLKKDVLLTTIPSEDLLILVVGSGGAGFTGRFPYPDLLSGERDSGVFPPPTEKEVKEGDVSVHVSYLNVPLLPDNWKGYDSADMIVLGDISADSFSIEQRNALIDWIYDGGTLVVSGGVNSGNLIGTFIEKLLPVRITGTRIMDSISSLLKQFGYDIGKTPVVVALSRLTGDSKAIVAEDDGLPIIAQKIVGAGRVTFLSFDYMDPVFRSWYGNRDLWNKLLPQPASRGEPRYSDVIRFLFAGMRGSGISPKFAGGFLLLYIICLGSISYLLLRRYKKAEWMWITIPVIASAFVLGLLGVDRATGERSPVVNELSVLSIYQDIPRARINSYFCLSSPVRSDLRISFQRPEAVFVSRIASRDVKAPAPDLKLIEGDIFQMHVPYIKTISSQLFYAESCVDFNYGALTFSRKDRRIKLNSNFPFDLSDCYVFSDGYYARIGDLKSGAHVEVRLDRAYSGNIIEVYSVEDAEKQRFISAVKRGFHLNVPDRVLIGWINQPVLKSLVGMDIGKDGNTLNKEGIRNAKVLLPSSRGNAGDTLVIVYL